tara:strand:+ start:1874 stop:2890 length:1017 start_codon:yes stop_codon:yes gene_type:complete
MKKILITGSIGFIGFHLTKALLMNGHEVVGVDNINDYYDINLKIARQKEIENLVDDLNLVNKYKFTKIDISNKFDINKVFQDNKFDIVINLAAQAGVRYSISNPDSYIESNLVGFTNILECCRNSDIKHFIFASSSSVYGMNKDQPFSTEDKTDFPISLYAATKKSNELLAFSYSHLYSIPSTGLRFFTVYGPYGRPDMAYYKFTKLINEGKPIDVYNEGDMKRDFTYVDDIIDGICKILNEPPDRNHYSSTTSNAPFRILNIGNNDPITLREFISSIEDALSKKAIENKLPMQPGDVPITYADIDFIKNQFGFNPKIKIKEGIKNFVDWYLDYESGN